MLNKQELITLHAPDQQEAGTGQYGTFSAVMTVVGMPIAIAYLFHKLGVIDLSVIFPLILPL